MRVRDLPSYRPPSATPAWLAFAVLLLGVAALRAQAPAEGVKATHGSSTSISLHRIEEIFEAVIFKGVLQGQRLRRGMVEGDLTARNQVNALTPA